MRTNFYASFFHLIGDHISAYAQVCNEQNISVVAINPLCVCMYTHLIYLIQYYTDFVAVTGYLWNTQHISYHFSALLFIYCSESVYMMALGYDNLGRKMLIYINY